MAESKSIYEKLAEMRVELQAKKLIKTGKNTYSKYEYYELSDFLPSCNSIAAQHKTLFKFAINENTASLTLINLENLEDVIEFSIPTANVSIQGATAMQNIGAVTTYARRYLYMIAMEISEDDNLDTADTAEKVTKEQQQRKEEAERQADHLLYPCLQRRRGARRHGYLHVRRFPRRHEHLRIRHPLRRPVRGLRPRPCRSESNEELRHDLHLHRHHRLRRLAASVQRRYAVVHDAGRLRQPCFCHHVLCCEPDRVEARRPRSSVCLHRRGSQVRHPRPA